MKDVFTTSWYIRVDEPSKAIQITHFPTSLHVSLNTSAGLIKVCDLHHDFILCASTLKATLRRYIAHNDEATMRALLDVNNDSEHVWSRQWIEASCFSDPHKNLYVRRYCRSRLNIICGCLNREVIMKFALRHLTLNTSRRWTSDARKIPFRPACLRLARSLRGENTDKQKTQKR